MYIIDIMDKNGTLLGSVNAKQKYNLIKSSYLGWLDLIKSIQVAWKSKLSVSFPGIPPRIFFQEKLNFYNRASGFNFTLHQTNIHFLTHPVVVDLKITEYSSINSLTHTRIAFFSLEVQYTGSLSNLYR